MFPTWDTLGRYSECKDYVPTELEKGSRQSYGAAVLLRACRTFNKTFEQWLWYFKLGFPSFCFGGLSRQQSGCEGGLGGLPDEQRSGRAEMNAVIEGFPGVRIDSLGCPKWT